jgi:hypothetical protein
MKLCQEVVCLDEIIAWNKIHIDYSKSYVSILVKVSPTLQGFNDFILKDSYLMEAQVREVRGPSPVIARESNVKNWRQTLKACS